MQPYFFVFFIKTNHPTSPKLYRSYYPHRPRELVSPVCGIFLIVTLVSEDSVRFEGRPCVLEFGSFSVVLLKPLFGLPCFNRYALYTICSYKTKRGNSTPNTVVHICCNMDPKDFQMDQPTDSKVCVQLYLSIYSSSLFKSILMLSLLQVSYAYSGSTRLLPSQQSTQAVEIAASLHKFLPSFLGLGIRLHISLYLYFDVLKPQTSNVWAYSNVRQRFKTVFVFPSTALRG